jgi:hypothetical protein
LALVEYTEGSQCSVQEPQAQEVVASLNGRDVRQQQQEWNAWVGQFGFSQRLQSPDQVGLFPP